MRINRGATWPMHPTTIAETKDSGLSSNTETMDFGDVPGS